MQLRPATKSKSKLRVGFAGPSGSGKTYSALLMASGMAAWDKICVIDTENMSADLYSDLGAYNVITLTPPFSPSRYIEAIKAAEDAGMEVIIVDSITHEWSGTGGALDIQNQMGGRFQDWAKVSPMHEKFKQAMLQSKCHIITTVRSKTDYMMTEEGGKSKVQKVGLKQETREGFEYELTLSFDLNINHLAETSKDRTGLFSNGEPTIISKDTGITLLKWANTGLDTHELMYEVADLLRTKQTTQTIESICRIYKVTGLELIPYHDMLAMRNKLRLLADKPKDPTSPIVPPSTPQNPPSEPVSPPMAPNGGDSQVVAPVELKVEPEAGSGTEAPGPVMASNGDLVLLRELILRRASQLGKDDKELKNQLYAKVGITDLAQLTKPQARQLIDMLTNLNTNYESEHEQKSDFEAAVEVFGPSEPTSPENPPEQTALTETEPVKAKAKKEGKKK